MTDLSVPLVERVGGSVIDFDTHYYEPEDCFTRYIDPKFRELAIQPKGPEGARLWTMGNVAARTTPPGMYTDVVPPPGFAAKLFSGKVSDFDVGFSDVAGGSENSLPLLRIAEHPEFFEREARLKVIGDQGLEASLILPTGAFFGYYEWIENAEALCANYTAFNRWVEETWGFGSADGRVIGVPMLNLLNVDWAVRELQSVATAGAKFCWIPQGPVNGRSPADPCFDKFWASVEEIGIKPVFHIGEEVFFAENYAAHWGEDPKRHIGEYSALQFYLSVVDRAITDTLAALILHNLFGRFPGIEIVSIENGSSWIPTFLGQLDKSAKLGGMGACLGGPLTGLPSEVFKQHVYVNPFHEEELPEIVEIMGADRVLFGSDWPHGEGMERPLDYLSSVTAQVSDEDARKIMHDNAAGLLGL